MFVRSILVCLDLCKNSSLNQSSNKLSIFLAQVFVRSLSGLTLLRRTDGAKNTKIFLTFPPHYVISSLVTDHCRVLLCC